MQFKFTKNLDYQLDAINSVVNIFDTGKNFIQTEEDFYLRNVSSIISNELEIDYIRIKKNLQSIQTQNNIKPETYTEDGSSFDGFFVSPDFSVEMETGTGKTYVYLRTILELNKKYGLKKFIILVPSIAIREGVLKTIQQTKEHFKDIGYNNFDYFTYDSDRLSKVREFAQSNDIQIMIMTIQSFNGDGRILKQTDRDNTYGEKSYIDLIAKTKPVVIMDEPQNMESDLAKSSIGDLNALFRLRYSATHKNVYNLAYKLTPVDAYRRGLVKKISVFGVKDNTEIFKVKNIIIEKGKNPKADVLIESKDNDGRYFMKSVRISVDDDLYIKSNKNEKFDDLIVNEIDAKNNRVVLSNDKYYKVEEVSENKELIFRTQIKVTIKAHFDKQYEIGDRVKVLSLFFIDKVDNYIHNDSLLRKIFIEEFNKLKNNYDSFKNLDSDQVHKGYFASKKIKGNTEYKDSTTGSSKDDKDAYDLIMKDKERLLSFNEPVSFVFSHSALKEGWDNPNIFQICTLKETESIMKKRQEIGRGLRLPVDVDGNRIYDKDIAKLTVIANSSYEEYAGGLQQEFSDSGYKGEVGIENKREEPIVVKTTKHLNSDDFKGLWNHINKKTSFNINVLTDQLTKKSILKINELNVRSITIIVEKGEIHFDKEGNLTSTIDNTAIGSKIETEIQIPNIIDRISRETNLTRKTIFEIISNTDNLNLIFKNPEEYIRSVVLIIKNELNNLLINEGLKYTKTGDIYSIELFDDFKSLPSKMINVEKSVFNHVVYDSKGEKEFAESLERDSKIKVYTKLPRSFYVDTPIGKYNPDWAIVWKADGQPEKFYLVRETKFGYEDLARDLSWEELQKISCARKHFKEIDVDFEVVQDVKLSDLIK